MTKYQEAFEDLCITWDEEGMGKDHFNNQYPYLYNTIKELVDKETPMKPENLKEKIVFESITKREWICPRCKHEYIGNPKIEYCCMCGQHIDWSDTNETY